MTAFRVEFIRFDGNGAEAQVLQRELQSQTVFDAEREALRMRDDSMKPLAVQFDAAFLRSEGPRVRRYGKNEEGISKWGRA